MKLLVRIAFFLNYVLRRHNFKLLSKSCFDNSVTETQFQSEIGNFFFFLQLINAMYSKIMSSRHSFNS